MGAGIDWHASPENKAKKDDARLAVLYKIEHRIANTGNTKCYSERHHHNVIEHNIERTSTQTDY